MKALIAVAVLAFASIVEAQDFMYIGPNGQFRQGYVGPYGGYSWGTGGWQQWNVAPYYGVNYGWQPLYYEPYYYGWQNQYLLQRQYYWMRW